MKRGRVLGAGASLLARAPCSLTVFVVCAAWLALSLAWRPLMLPDEGRYVGVAWEMLGSGNWLVPTLDGLPFFHKPPLFYWLTAASLGLFGANEWSARAASLLAATAAVVGLHLFLRRHSPDERLPAVAAAVLLTLPLFFGGAQFANLDMLVAAMISLTILFGAYAVLSLECAVPHRVPLTLAYVFAALGVLAKGLIGVVLPAAVVLVWLIVSKRWRHLPALLPLHLVLMLLLIVVPWFWAMQQAYSDFLDYFFVHHHFQRFAQTGFNNPKPFWFYLPVLLVGAFPWSPWMVRALTPRYLQDPARFDLRSLMVVWLLVVLLFFSLPSSKLVGYILPALPPLACLLADVFLAWLGQRSPARQRVYARGGVLVAGGLCLALVLIAAQRSDPVAREQIVGAAPLFRTDDQIVMLDDYRYDLPVYLKARKSPWVVSDWARPDLLAKDNWRRELYEAGRFDPAAARERLLFPADLRLRACGEPPYALWIWGKKAMASDYPFLRDEWRVLTTADDDALWRIAPEASRALRGCDETPKNG